MSLSVRLTRRLGAFTLDAAFEAPPGATVLFGRSGAGKTLIVEAVAGLSRPDAGRIALGDRLLYDSERRISVPPHRRRIGYVFQDARLFPHLSVRGNLGYGRWFAGRRAAPDWAPVVEMLDLGAVLDRRPADLSGGEKQRVAIGRALLSGPELLLADEPLAALDAPRKAEILPYFERLRDAAALPIVYVSHSVAEVARLATTVVALEAGRVVAQGPAGQVLGDPAVAPAGVRAVGAVLETRVAAHHADGLTELAAGPARLWLPRIAQAVGAPVRVRIPAQEVMLSRGEPHGLSALNILPGVVEAVRAGAGPGAIVSLRTGAGLVLARVTQRSAARLEIAPGARLWAVLKSVAVAPEDVGGP